MCILMASNFQQTIDIHQCLMDAHFLTLLKYEDSFKKNVVLAGVASTKEQLIFPLRFSMSVINIHSKMVIFRGTG